ncbi:MAG: M1 family metallopeptidase [Clostridia bacterium]|nr:M1 family metallopeptidase [Clostridia bacterium]
MKRLKRFAIVFALIICVSAFVGCNDGGLDEISKGLSTYDINASYDGEEHKLTASMTVDYVNNYDVELDRVEFHLYPSAYREGARFAPIEKADEAKAYPSGKNYGGITVTNVTVGSSQKEVTISGSDEDILCVTLDDKLLPGAKVKIGVDFEVKLANVRHRLGYNGKTVNLGNFYPVACVYENGGFRTDPYYAVGDPFYSEAANYNVTMKYPAGYKMAHTGSGSHVADGDSVTASITASAVRDFAAVLGEFETKETKVGDTSVMYFYYADTAPDASLKAAADALTTFNDKFGKYPYPTYSVVQTSFLQGGMEYPNLSLISDAMNNSTYIDAVIHETAHQWWYGVVGNDETANSWLDEGLTEYSASLFYALNPDYGVEFEKRISDALSSLMLYIELYKPGFDADTSMDRSLAEYADNMEYTYMTYVKGQLMFDNLRRIIGDDAFYAALKDYYTANYLKIALPDSLIACFEKAAKRELKAYFDSWTQGNVKLFQ